MKKLLLLALLASCQSVDKQPPPMEPEEPSVAEPSEPDGPPNESPDQQYVREFDQCTKVYRLCLRKDADTVCFPKRKSCVIKAYRKLKRARGQ